MSRRRSIAPALIVVIIAALAFGIIAGAIDSTKTEQVQK